MIGTPITDAAEKARTDYINTAPEYFGAPEEDQMEWVRKCPPGGWKIARELELKFNEARKDKERLDWLEKQGSLSGPVRVIGCGSVRQAIDSAMANIKQP